MEKAIDAKAVATILGVHFRHVLKMAKRGELPARRIGSSWKFRESEIERWWQEGNMASRNHSRRSEERTA